MKAFKVLIICPQEEAEKIQLSQFTDHQTTEVELWFPEELDSQKILLKLLTADEIKFAGSWHNDPVCNALFELSYASSLLIKSTQNILGNVG